MVFVQNDILVEGLDFRDSFWHAYEVSIDVPYDKLANLKGFDAYISLQNSLMKYIL